MPDPARIAQAQVLEIPVTVQGEKTVDETGRREPFAESAKTALTFDNGAVVKLQARVKAGESVSLRNEQSGKEIQCKVLEVPPEGQIGYTDLEFVETVPDFWEGHAEQAEVTAHEPEAGAAKSEEEGAAEKPEPAVAAAEQEAREAEPAANAESTAENPEPAAVAAEPEAVAAQPEAAAPAEAEAAADDSLAMMEATASELKLPPPQVQELDPPLPPPPPPAPAPQEIPKGRLREELVPAHEMVPEMRQASIAPPAPAASSAPFSADPTGEQIDAALRRMEAALAPPQDAAEPSDAKDEANLAALMAREARLAKYAALREKAASQIGRAPAPQGASKEAPVVEGEAGETAEGEEEASPPKVPLVERLTTGKNLIVSEIVVSLAILVAVGFIWHAVSGLFIRPINQRVAAAASARKSAPSTAPPQVVAQTPAAATPVVKVPGATPSASGSEPVAKDSSTKPAAAISAPVASTSSASVSAAKIVPSAPASYESATNEGPRVVELAPENEPPEDVARAQPKYPENLPAKIVAAPQPGFPSWAKKLDVGSVVRLDAVIDEKGNLGETRIVSGPRLLERAAEQAVQLWIFEPAQLNGKPAATHIILTVEFQR